MSTFKRMVAIAICMAVLANQSTGQTVIKVQFPPLIFSTGKFEIEQIFADQWSIQAGFGGIYRHSTLLWDDLHTQVIGLLVDGQVRYYFAAQPSGNNNIKVAPAGFYAFVKGGYMQTWAGVKLPTGEKANFISGKDYVMGIGAGAQFNFTPGSSRRGFTVDFTLGLSYGFSNVDLRFRNGGKQFLLETNGFRPNIGLALGVPLGKL